MKTAIFKKYKNGYFTFEFESGEDMVFDEVHPKILSHHNLIEDKTLRGKTFQLTFSERYQYDDEVIYRIESLKLKNT